MSLSPTSLGIDCGFSMGDGGVFYLKWVSRDQFQRDCTEWIKSDQEHPGRDGVIKMVWKPLINPLWKDSQKNILPKFIGGPIVLRMCVEKNGPSKKQSLEDLRYHEEEAKRIKEYLQDNGINLNSD